MLPRTLLLVAAALASPAIAHDPDRHLSDLDRQIARAPSEPAPYLERAELLRRRGALQRALRDYDTALALEHGLEAAHLGRARVLLAARRSSEAERAVDRFLLTRPDHGPALWTRARILADLGERERAADAYDAALAKLQRRLPEHYVERAGAHSALGRTGIERAIAGLDEGIASLGPLVSLLEPAVGLEVHLRRYDNAVARLDRLIAMIARPQRWVTWREEVIRRAAGAPATRASLPAPPRSTATASPRRSAATPPAAPPRAETTLIPAGATWRYLDDGSNQGSAWTGLGFDDSGWASGPAQLGYGDGDEVTTVSFGGNSSNKHVTTYFRHAFSVADAMLVLSARIRLLRDDGAVVYLNGTEVARSNMPSGTITHTTFAASTVGGASEDTFFSIPIDQNQLVTGPNVLAVEIHQRTATSSDISFDLELLGSDTAISVIRGPYLQRGTPTSGVVRWRTVAPGETVVWTGPNPGLLTPTFADLTPTTEHVAELTGLTPETTYYYAIGDLSGILAGADLDHSFVTPPVAGADRPTRVWVIGDSGTANIVAQTVRDAYLTFTGARRTDVWLMLGDNAYNSGTDLEYQAAVFDMYPSLLRSTFVWPTLGNHDRLSADSATETGPYYDIFTLPRNAEAGGLPSGTEAYYSFDHGPIHFICLDSDDTNRSPAGPMMTWLTADLANTTAKWNIAFWHHPPYTKGSHNSDTDDGGFDMRMREMRERALPLLEAAGVDLVLTGHSHSYERSMLLDGHYGVSSTLTPAMQRDPGDGDPAGHGTYNKHTLAKGANEGTVYAVAGCSGKRSGGPLDHPAMIVSLDTLGSMVLDVDGNTLDARFLQWDGAVVDHFQIHKGAPLTRDTPTISVASGGTSNLSLNAGTAEGGNYYFVLGSFGTTPGFDIGSVHVPLNPDAWFDLTVIAHNTALFPNSLGTFDASGQGTSAVTMPANAPPSLVGQSIHHAYVVLDGSFSWRMASNAIKISFTP